MNIIRTIIQYIETLGYKTQTSTLSGKIYLPQEPYEIPGSSFSIHPPKTDYYGVPTKGSFIQVIYAQQTIRLQTFRCYVLTSQYDCNINDPDLIPEITRLCKERLNEKAF